MKNKSVGMPVALIAAVLLLGAGQAMTLAADPEIDALVKFKDDVPLPAKEPGVLLRLEVKEGDEIKKGQQIGLIDDNEPQMQKKVAQYALAAAVKKANDDVEIKYSKAQAAVAEKDYEILLDTNRRAARAVSDVEVRRAKLDWDRAVLAIEKSGKDQELARYEAYTKQAELDAADLAIKRRMMIAPFDGQVVEIRRKQDEWVSPGDVVMRVARRDVMYVEGAVNQSDFDPHELEGSNVSVVVQLARGRNETVPGKIIHASPVLNYDGRYIVRAEVENRQAGGSWVLLDGQPAKMTIHVNTPGAAAEVSRRP